MFNKKHISSYYTSRFFSLVLSEKKWRKKSAGAARQNKRFVGRYRVVL